ncbi:MAG TPA: bifunctional demethylmenaquinone methyltransferase/2-methoxy-6-polyprenyl-1,4-benzoquinol methylase UbiE [Pirellulales bacterium]|jgi:demethylmenaquinone methyltransferase/2-methoxy-6-polyprenyl-1,4-benzoquinol methylase|nr:bifunctional demethylmenaquinone methyltransferase/2-methoxy-6-polyprenyl-1,4-benzoquinol methylase UbiE [Pirellulales bacterium]
MPVDKSEARVRRMFGEIAGRYDLVNHLTSLGVDIYWRWRTVRKVPPVGDAPILDLCTGTGDLALAYYQAGRRRTPVVGADFCRPMLVLGRGKARQAGAEHVTFVEADAQCLPFEDDRFQIVSVAFGLRNVTDTDRGLREMVRVCRPGGRIVVLEFARPRWQPFKALFGFYFRYVLPRIGQALARNRHDAYHYLPHSVVEFPAGEALAERIRAAGASDVRYHQLTMGIATLYVGTK